MKFISKLAISIYFLATSIYSSEKQPEVVYQVPVGEDKISVEKHPNKEDCNTVIDGIDAYNKVNLEKISHDTAQHTFSIRGLNGVVIGADAFVTIENANDLNLIKKLEYDLLQKGATRVFIHQTSKGYKISDELLTENEYKILDKDLRYNNKEMEKVSTTRETANTAFLVIASKEIKSPKKSALSKDIVWKAEKSDCAAIKNKGKKIPIDFGIFLRGKNNKIKGGMLCMINDCPLIVPSIVSSKKFIYISTLFVNEKFRGKGIKDSKYIYCHTKSTSIESL